MFKLLFLVFFLVSCKNNSSSLSESLKNKYANIEVNDFENKKNVINEIEKLEKNSLLKEIDYELALNKLNDGHVFLINKAFY